MLVNLVQVVGKAGNLEPALQRRMVGVAEVERKQRIGPVATAPLTDRSVGSKGDDEALVSDKP
jgi:hypothetical protein